MDKELQSTVTVNDQSVMFAVNVLQMRFIVIGISRLIRLPLFTESIMDDKNSSGEMKWFKAYQQSMV